MLGWPFRKVLVADTNLFIPDGVLEFIVLTTFLKIHNIAAVYMIPYRLVGIFDRSAT